MTTSHCRGEGPSRTAEDVFDHFGIRSGKMNSVEKRPSDRIEIRAAKEDVSVSDMFGARIRMKGPRLSIEEINRITARSGLARSENRWRVDADIID